MNFEAEFFRQFGEKFSSLYLKNVVVSGDTCTITFLYPSTDENIPDEDKEAMSAFTKEKLNLENLRVKVKFLKAYVEEKLILKHLLSLLEDKFKLLKSYIHEDDIKIEITNIDCNITFDVSPRIAQFFADNKVSAFLSKDLKENFLTNFNINLNVLSDKVDEVELESVQLKTSARRTQRYDVLIIKEVIGGNIPTKPEYISFIQSPKSSVILAGYISDFERKDFVIKKGTRAGQQKA